MHDTFHYRKIASTVILFFIFFFAFLWASDIRATYGASITGDEPFYLLTTKSLISDQDLDLQNQYQNHDYEEFFDHEDGLWKQSVPLSDGTLLSPHNPGLSVFLMPGYFLGGLFGAQMQMAVTAAITWALAFLLAFELSKSFWLSILSTLSLGLSATAVIYGSEIYPEVPAALVLVLSLLYLKRVTVDNWWKIIIFIFLVSLLPWLGTKYAILGLVLVIWSLCQIDRVSAVKMLGGLALSGGVYIWFHLVTFEGLTPYNVNMVYYNNSTWTIFGFHIDFINQFYRLWGLLLDRRFGLVHWQPITLLTLPGLFFLARQSAIPRVIAVLVGAQWLVACFVAITMMGYWFPGRTVMTIFPLLPCLLVVILERYSASKLLWISFVITSLYGLLTSYSLIQAGKSMQIVVAFNPFELDSWLFKQIGFLFPQYTSWTFETWILTVVWLAVGFGLMTSIVRAGSQKNQIDI